MFLSFSDLIERVAEARDSEKTVVLCHGCFDPLHPGHIKYFQAAKKMGDILVVTLSPDCFIDKGPGRPAFDEKTRAESIDALQCVDFVAVNEWPTAEETLRQIRPSYYVKGQEFEGKDDITGKLQKEIDVLKEIGGELRFTYEEVYSSSKILNEQFGMLSEDVAAFMGDLKRSISIDDALETLQRIRDLKILVIGDTIIDEYRYCKGIGKSVKAHVVSTKLLHTEFGAGASLCIANHLGGFCSSTSVITVLGEDNDFEPLIRESLHPSVRFLPIHAPGRPTPVKTRYIDSGFKQKVFEVHVIDDSPINEETTRQAMELIKEEVEKADIVIAGDFGHGFLHDQIATYLSKHAGFLAATVQTNSNNYGFNLVTKYPRADFIALDLREAELAVQDRISAPRVLAKKLLEKQDYAALAVTLGRQGSLLTRDGNSFTEAPLVMESVVDSVGAGDAFLALSAPTVFLGVDPRLTLLFGNLAGALAANIVGNATAIRPVDFRNMLVRFFK